MHPIVFPVGPLGEDDDFPASFNRGEQCVSTPYEVFINIHDDAQDKLHDGFVSELNSDYTLQPQYITGNSPGITKHVAHLEDIISGRYHDSQGVGPSTAAEGSERRRSKVPAIHNPLASCRETSAVCIGTAQVNVSLKVLLK